jgi:hypothetical protein
MFDVGEYEAPDSSSEYTQLCIIEGSITAGYCTGVVATYNIIPFLAKSADF